MYHKSFIPYVTRKGLWSQMFEQTDNTKLIQVLRNDSVDQFVELRSCNQTIIIALIELINKQHVSHKLMAPERVWLMSVWFGVILVSVQCNFPNCQCPLSRLLQAVSDSTPFVSMQICASNNWWLFVGASGRIEDILVNLKDFYIIILGMYLCIKENAKMCQQGRSLPQLVCLFS